MLQKLHIPMLSLLDCFPEGDACMQGGGTRRVRHCLWVTSSLGAALQTLPGSINLPLTAGGRDAADCAACSSRDLDTCEGTSFLTLTKTSMGAEQHGWASWGFERLSKVKRGCTGGSAPISGHPHKWVLGRYADRSCAVSANCQLA